VKESNKSKAIMPFLKWPGGKRWLVLKYNEILPTSYNHYFEPFLGGGAVFFYLQPKEATLSDVNHDLIATYTIMRDMPDKLASLLAQHEKNHSAEYYYRIRETEYSDAVQAAARFMYLNRACFNGMYRVNKEGKFNVPIGTKTNFTYDMDSFVYYSDILKKADLTEGDFAKIIQRAEKNDFVFADPPYTVSKRQNSFIKYNDRLFTWADQNRLFEALYAAKSRGATVISTNANNEEIKTLYSSHGFYTKTVQHYSLISGKADKRREQEELLISSQAFSDKQKERF